MARFKTHTEGGSWTGGGTEVPNCSTTERSRIQTALTDIRRKIGGCTLSGLDDLKDALLDLLNCSLEIDCNASGCNPTRAGYTPGDGCIVLCSAALSATQQSLNAVVFHEMIHAAGGTELDAEAFENHCYAGQGATAPTTGDWPKFHDDGGEWVIWDEDTCELFVKVVEGGSWVSSGTVSRGDRLSPSFCEPPAAGGGGSWI